MKKLNNKILVIALVGLATVFVITRWFRSSTLDGNIRTQLTSLDRDLITEVQIASKDSLIRLLKEGGRWFVVKDNFRIDADSGTVARMVQSLSTIRAKRMASRKKEKWAEYKVDSSATRVSAYYGTEKKVQLNIGTLGFNQNSNGGGGMNQNIEPYTFVRLEGENDVYVVDGFLSATFPPSLKEWRRKASTPADTVAHQ